MERLASVSLDDKPAPGGLDVAVAQKLEAAAAQKLDDKPTPGGLNAAAAQKLGAAETRIGTKVNDRPYLSHLSPVKMPLMANAVVRVAQNNSAVSSLDASDVFGFWEVG